jgi:prepilin-type N-terminal cleavage/methylation domain-containing protein
MLQELRKRVQGRDEGFTLIELLIVIIVLGILAAIVLFGVATFRSDAIDACNDANDRTIASAQAAYVAAGGPTPHPPSEQTLVDDNYIDELPECES